MKKLIAPVVALALAIAVVSCGGSGSPKVFSSTARSVQNMQRFSFLSMGNSGLGFPAFWGGEGAGTSGGTTGSGTGGGSGGPSSIGGFVRNFGGPSGTGPMMRRHALGEGTSGSTGGVTGDTTGGETSTGGTTTGGTDGGGGGTGGDYFYYDEWLQLWVQTEWTETTFTSNFYLDQAKTSPAGHITSTFVTNWEVYPQSYTSEYEFTAGTMAGAHGTYNCTQTNEFEGSMTYADQYSDGSHDSGSSNWDATGSTWQSRWDGANKTGWYQDSGSWSFDGSGTYSCSNSDGWSSTWHYNADWSGSAHFEGPDPKLPADLTWTPTGHYRITYADGTSEEWNWDDLWEREGGKGTTGTTGLGGFLAVPKAVAAKPVKS
jgi:hypothetical protein